jgi:hypothetical protein
MSLGLLLGIGSIMMLPMIAGGITAVWSHNSTEKVRDE